MRHRGFTILELLVATLVIAITLSVAIPSLGWLIQDARRTADINALVTSIQLARSESAKRSLPVIVCKTSDRHTCGDSSVHYEQGWMVFVNEDGGQPPAIDAGEQLLFAYQPRTEGSIRSNRSRYTFRPYFRRSTNGTITFCDHRGGDAARAVIVSYTGRPRVSGEGPGGRRLICAG